MFTGHSNICGNVKRLVGSDFGHVYDIWGTKMQFKSTTAYFEGNT
jgi:hypothetical protein